MSEKQKIEQKMIYLCNGERPNCLKTICYRKYPEGGVCRLTTHREYAADPNPVVMDTGKELVWLEGMQKE